MLPPSISSPAADMGMIRKAGPMPVTPPRTVASVVNSVQTPISSMAETVGRPTRTSTISAVKNTAMTMTAITGADGPGPASGRGGAWLVRRTSQKATIAVKTGISRMGSAFSTNCPRRCLSSGGTELSCIACRSRIINCFPIRHSL